MRRLVLASLALIACRSPTSAQPAPAAKSAAADARPSSRADATAEGDADDRAASAPDAAPNVDTSPRPIGPFEEPFVGKRNVYFVVPRSRAKPQRLIANLHGICNPPGYACGFWVNAASELGFLVCPTGNSSCGPTMYNAPTWTEPAPKMDEDLEKAIATVSDRYPGEVSREGSVLTGFSRGAYVAVEIAKIHPGRWPYLVLNEADVSLNASQLRAAGVLAVALVAGEYGSQVADERRTANQLRAQGYPARLWVMPKAGHNYSDNIDAIMKEAIEWVTDPATQPTDGGRDASDDR